MRVRQQRVSPRRRLLLAAVATAAMLSTVPAVMAGGHDTEKEAKKAKGGVKVETYGGLPDTVIVQKHEGDKATTEDDMTVITFKECQVTAGRGGQSDLGPVFDAIKGCPTGLITLLSPAQGGPQAYSWNRTSTASEVPNLLIYGSGVSAKGKKGDDKKKLKDFDEPPVTIELSGTGPFRTGPWGAHDVAFKPSATAPLEGTPFEIKAGDADLSDVMFSGFEGPVFKISEDYTLKILGGLFEGNHNNNEVDATVDVDGGTLYCHRCHFTENEGTAIKATGADSLVGLSYSKFVNNTATGGLIQAASSRGGFASTSFINNTVTSPLGAVVALKDGSLFLGHNALFRDNVGGDLLAEDSHFRIDKSLFKGSQLNLASSLAEQVAEHLLPDADAGAGASQKVAAGSDAQEPPAPLEDAVVEAPAAEAGGVTRVRRRLQEEVDQPEPVQAPEEATTGLAPAEPQPQLLAVQEGSVARLYGASSLRGFNNFFDGTQGPAILALDASNVTLGRPCFTNDAPGVNVDAATDGARFVEARSVEGNLTLWGVCAFPTTDNTTALYGAADVVIDEMEAESVALTPFSPLAIDGDATGVMPPQNGTCIKHCAAGFVPPKDWDPAARPPPGKNKNEVATLNFDEKTGTVSVTYPKDYKGPQVPAFKLPLPPGISFSVGPSKGRRSLRGPGAASFLDNMVKAVKRRMQFPFVIPFSIPDDIEKQLGISDEDVNKAVNSAPVPPPPQSKPQPLQPAEVNDEEEEEFDELDEDDIDDVVISLFAGTMVPPPPEEIVSLAAPTVVIATGDEVVVAKPVTEGGKEEDDAEEKDEEDEDEEEKEDDKAEKDAEKEEAAKENPVARLQNDLSAPWDNNRDADKWNKPDWSFLANFPAIPNSAASKAHGNSEKQKEAVKAARAYDAYMAFLESNPGVALPSSAEPAPIPTETTTEPATPEFPATPSDESKEVIDAPTDAPVAAPEPGAETPTEEAKDETLVAPEETPEPTAAATEATSKVSEATAAVCPEGETPLVLYLDSGSTGEYEACTAATNGTAAYYFVAKAGDSEARTFALPENSEAGSFALMQILDLGCQPPSNVLEVELRNELNPNVTCARWLVPNWADELAGQGTAVTIDKETGDVKEVQDANEVVPTPPPEPTTVEPKPAEGILAPADEPKPEVPEPAPVEEPKPEKTEPAAEKPIEPEPTPEASEGELSIVTDAPAVEIVDQGATRRHRHRHRLLQAASSTTTYDITAESEAAAPAESDATEPAKQAAAPANATGNTTTTTIVAVPIELGESDGGSLLKVVVITDSETLAETYQLEFNLPGLKGTVTMPGASPSEPVPTAEAPLPAGGEALEAQAAEGTSMQQKKKSNAGAAAGGVIAALIGLAAVAALVVVIRKRRRNADGQDEALWAR